MATLRQFGNRVYKARWAYFFILPNLLLYAVFFLVPVAWSMVLSFLDYQWWGIEFVGFSNYSKVFADPIFWKALVNTAYYTLGVVPLWLGKALIISALIFPFRKPLQTFFKAAFYLPHVTSAVILSMIWLWIYNPPFGLLNYVLGFFGVDPVAWLGNTLTAMPSLILMQVVMGGGSSIVLISAAMNGIPSYLYEAAELDGARPLQLFLRVTLPLLKPTLLYLVVTGTINSFQVFTNIYLMTRGGPQFSTTTIVYMIYDTAFKQFQFGPASAMAMVLFVITAVFALVQFRWLGQEVEY
ncbi:MAG TPA: sugar ABC transporter permease [Limnochordia bacterium]|nr:sugar ABC transporter permease [Limnochordia bacterium]